jgi:hypothetical protein
MAEYLGLWGAVCCDWLHGNQNNMRLDQNPTVNVKKELTSAPPCDIQHETTTSGRGNEITQTVREKCRVEESLEVVAGLGW